MSKVSPGKEVIFTGAVLFNVLLIYLLLIVTVHVYRFGIELPNPPTDQGSSTQPQDNDMPLSEGFHWESFSDRPSDPSPTLPPPPQDPTNFESHKETHSESQLQEPLEQPGTAKQGSNRRKVKAASVKVEPNLEVENEDSRDNSSASRRKHNIVTVSGLAKASRFLMKLLLLKCNYYVFF